MYTISEVSNNNYVNNTYVSFYNIYFQYFTSKYMLCFVIKTISMICVLYFIYNNILEDLNNFEYINKRGT